MKTEPKNPHYQSEFLDEVRRVVADWINRESYRSNLISVTKCDISEYAGRVTVFISVFPESGLAGALSLLRRHGDAIAKYFVMKHKNRRKPFFIFEADVAARNYTNPDEIRDGADPSDTSDSDR